MKTPENWQSLQLRSVPSARICPITAASVSPGALYSLATLGALPELPIPACTVQTQESQKLWPLKDHDPGGQSLSSVCFPCSRGRENLTAITRPWPRRASVSS